MSSLSAIEEFKLKRSAFPLASFMQIYNSAQHLCYINYMQGATVLAKYLQPIKVTQAAPAVPHMHRSYELHELAKIIARYAEGEVTFQQAENAIYEYHRQLLR